MMRGKVPPSVATIEAFLDAFSKATSKERYGFARMLQQVLLSKPSIRGQVKSIIQEHPLAMAQDLHLKTMQFRAKLYPFGNKIFPLDRFAQDVLSDILYDGGLRVAMLDPKQLSAEQMKFLTKAERVHELSSMEELQRRLMGNRKGYGLWHHRMEPFPLAIVYVALENHLPSSLLELDELASSKPSTSPSHAIFYSISLCQLGAKGLGLGRHLLLAVLQELSYRHSSLKHFQTISPITRFDEWLKLRQQDTFETVHDYAALAQKYLDECWRRRSRIVDPVAAFHYANGAKLECVLSDANPRSSSSFGLMASYKYEWDHLEERSREYKRMGELKSSKL